LLFYQAYAINKLLIKENKKMNTEQESTITPDAELNQSQVDSDLIYPPAGYAGELPGGNGLPQPTDDEIITNVPGSSGDASRPPSVIDTDSDWEAIAHERQLRGQEELLRVAGNTAVQSAQLDSNTPEQ